MITYFIHFTGFESSIEHHKADGRSRSKTAALPTGDRTPNEEHLRSIAGVVESECRGPGR